MSKRKQLPWKLAEEVERLGCSNVDVDMTGRKHAKVWFTDLLGKKVVYFCPKTPSDKKAEINSVRSISRMARGTPV